MTDFRERYKRLGFGRENAQVNRALRSKRHNEHRHERRSQLFGVNRVQSQCSDSSDNASKDSASTFKRPGEAAKTDDKELAKQHAKWRKESYNRKLVEKKVNKKPPFVVGVVHHKVYSPPFSKEKIPTPPTRLCKLKENQPVPVPKTVTQATLNRRAAKAQESKAKLEVPKTKKTKETEKEPLAPNAHEFKAPEGINAIPLFGRRAVEAAQQSLLNQDFQSSGNRSIASFISDDSYSLNPNNTSTPLQPSASVSSALACISDRELRAPVPGSSEKVVFQTQLQKTLFDESIHLESEARDSPKTPTPEETTSTLVEQTSLSVQLFKRSSTIRNSDEGGAYEEPTSLSVQVFNRTSPSRVGSNDEGGAPEKQSSPSVHLSICWSASTVRNNDEGGVPEKQISPSAKLSIRLSSPSTDRKGDEVVSREEQTSPSGKPANRLSPSTVRNEEEDRVCGELKRSEEASVKNNSSKQEEYTVQYFKHLLNKEIERLNGLCDSWALVKGEPSTPEDMHYLIQSAIGQTQLLVRKKFQRFEGLVQDCETGAGEMPVTCKDLLGFWELTYIEVEDCDARFKKLEELKANGWVDEELASRAKPQPKRKPVVKKEVASEKKIVRSDSLRAHIAAVRRKMKPAPTIIVQETGDNIVPETIDLTNEQGKPTTGKYQERRNSEETRRSSEKKIPTIKIEPVENESPKVLSLKAASNQPMSPMNKLVLRKAHLSQARKSSKSPLVALKISRICKTPEVQSDASIACTGVHTTPAGRLLKSPRGKRSSSKSAEKSERIDSLEQQLSANTECLETVEKEKRTIKKRLSFEENDSIIASPVKVGDTMPSEKRIAESEFNNNDQSVKSSGLLLRNLFYINTSRRITCEKESPVKEDTPKPSEVNGTHSEISSRKNEINLSIASKQKNLRISPRKDGPTTPRRRSMRIQKLNESKNRNQDT